MMYYRSQEQGNNHTQSLPLKQKFRSLYAIFVMMWLEMERSFSIKGCLTESRLGVWALL